MSGRGRGKGDGRRGGGGAGRVKRQQVDTDDGWTVITHGVGKMGLNSNAAGTKKKDKSGLKVAGQMPSHTVEGLTVEKMQLDFERLRERWNDSDVAKQLTEILKEGEMHGRVNEAVCIGIGSFSRDWEHRWRSMWQLVLFQFITSQLSSSTPPSDTASPSEDPSRAVVAYAQDPAFTSLDIDFLAALNITALDSGIEDKISAESFVYSPFVDWFLLLPMFLNGKDPVLYVGNEILDDYTSYAQTEEKKEKLEECNTLGKGFLREREEGKKKLKEFEGHAHAINGMVVYTRSPSPVLESTTTSESPNATTPADVPT